MGLLDKTNPRATGRSVIRHAIIGAIFTPAFFFLFGKPAVRAYWAALLPVFAVPSSTVRRRCRSRCSMLICPP